MPKTLETEKYTIGTMLGRYERRHVLLPEFQRSFSWEKAQVAQFWDDLLRFQKVFAQSPNKATYFLGPIVLIEHDESILLLDGQQRLATATIVMAAIRDVARTLDKGNGIKGANLARDIQSELVEKNRKPITYSLTLSELDEPYFLNAIKTDPPLAPASKLRSHQLIQAAYTQSIERLNNLVKAKTIDESIALLESIRDALTTGMTLVAMVVQSEEDASTIFETLNDRGLRLSVPDLVLNLLMKLAPDATARKLVRQHWNMMLRELGRRDVSRFLRHLWVSHYGDLKAEGLFAAIKKDIEAKKLESVQFADQCEDECDTYVALLDANVPISKEGITNLEGIVRYLQIHSAPPLLLAGYRCLNPQDFEVLVKAIITVHIRFAVATNQNPLEVESRFYEAARAIRKGQAEKHTSGQMLQAAVSKLRELKSTDLAIEQASNELILERSEAVWLMTRLANTMQSKTKEIGMDKANLEHVFPQRPTLAAWPNMTALEPLTWHIGNLTILGERINRKAQNKSFSDKCNQHYVKSEIEMTKELLKVQSWDEAVILQRGKELAKSVAKQWPAL